MSRLRYIVRVFSGNATWVLPGLFDGEREAQRKADTILLREVVSVRGDEHIVHTYAIVEMWRPLKKMVDGVLVPAVLRQPDSLRIIGQPIIHGYMVSGNDNHRRN